MNKDTAKDIPAGQRRRSLRNLGRDPEVSEIEAAIATDSSRKRKRTQRNMGDHDNMETNHDNTNGSSASARGKRARREEDRARREQAALERKATIDKLKKEQDARFANDMKTANAAMAQARDDIKPLIQLMINSQRTQADNAVLSNMIFEANLESVEERLEERIDDAVEDMEDRYNEISILQQSRKDQSAVVPDEDFLTDQHNANAGPSAAKSYAKAAESTPAITTPSNPAGIRREILEYQIESDLARYCIIVKGIPEQERSIVGIAKEKHLCLTELKKVYSDLQEADIERTSRFSKTYAEKPEPIQCILFDEAKAQAILAEVEKNSKRYPNLRRQVTKEIRDNNKRLVDECNSKNLTAPRGWKFITVANKGVIQRIIKVKARPPQSSAEN